MSNITQLSGQDTTFLYMDTDRASTGGTMIYIYDQSTVPEGKLRFKRILKYIEDNLDISPFFRRKLKQVPLALDYPYWVTDEDFRIENHVTHVALPKPGDWRQFCILASRLTRPHYDMSRPLWEMYVVEGLDNIDWLPKGSFAILTRVHHASVDGTACAELTWNLHQAADGESRARQLDTGIERDPSALEMASRAIYNNVTSPLRLARPLANVLPAVGEKLLEVANNRMRQPLDEPADTLAVPKTRFNQKVSPQRVYTSTAFALDSIKPLRRPVEGSTLNDVVVSVIGGALRKYLQHHDELPDESLVTLMPVNTREKTKAAGTGNNITFMAAALGSHIADPIERLRFVYDKTSRSKTVLNGVGANELTDISKHAPAALLAAAGRTIAQVGFDSAGTGKRLFNVMISNVPGPTEPIFLKGAEMKFWSIVGPLADGAGLIFPITSYNGKLFIALTSCHDMLPDPDFMGQCIEESFSDLEKAVTTDTDIDTNKDTEQIP